jgi:hypothetical protein
MELQQTLAEWLAEDDRRYVVMRQSTQANEDGTTTVREGQVQFDVYSHLPDGRRVATGVTVASEMLEEPSVGDYVLMQAKLATANLLRGQVQ